MRVAQLLLTAILLVAAEAKIYTVTATNGKPDWSAPFSTPYVGIEPLNITVGDTLLFQYYGPHTIDWLLNADSYATCNASGSIRLGFPDVPPPCNGYGHCFEWKAEAPGSYYFACTVDHHCEMGMKIAVTVFPTELGRNCTYLDFQYTNGSKICTNGTEYQCDEGEWILGNSSCGACTYGNTTYGSEDWVCDNDGHSQLCRNGTWQWVGTCGLMQWVNCSYYGADTKCATSYSSSLQQSFVYCGSDRGFEYAKGLCYYNAGEHWCSNNHLGSGQNWIMMALAEPQHRAIPCPSS